VGGQHQALTTLPWGMCLGIHFTGGWGGSRLVWMSKKNLSPPPPWGSKTKPNCYNSLRLIGELKTMCTKILAKICFSWLGELSKKGEELLHNDFVEILISVTVHSII